MGLILQAPLTTAMQSSSLCRLLAPFTRPCSRASFHQCRQDDVKAMALLQRMPTDAARAALLQQLGHVDAARASACRALLAADATAVASDLADADMAEAGVGDKEQQEARVEQPAAAMAMQRGSSMWARAGARRATKRAASAALSDDDEETDVEELEVSRWGGIAGREHAGLQVESRYQL